MFVVEVYDCGEWVECDAFYEEHDASRYVQALNRRGSNARYSFDAGWRSSVAELAGMQC